MSPLLINGKEHFPEEFHRIEPIQSKRLFSIFRYSNKDDKYKIIVFDKKKRRIGKLQTDKKNPLELKRLSYKLMCELESHLENKFDNRIW